MATINYVLSSVGQRASLLAGGDGKVNQSITVERDDPLFPRLLARASISTDGTASLNVGSWVKVFDAPQTAGEVLDALDALDAAKVAKEMQDAAKKKEETLAALKERRTTKHNDTVSVDREGKQVASNGIATAECRYETPDWPYYADTTVKGSEEAKAWETALAEAKATALEMALAEARAKVPAFLAAEKETADIKAEKVAALIARKESMGGTADDYLLRIEDGAIQNIPLSRGDKSWLAIIEVSPSSPGGLAREFAAKARGGAYYMLPSFAIGDAVEFGEDAVSRRGKKTIDRWYGFVVAITDSAVLLRPCSTGKSACQSGKKHVAKMEKAAK